MKVLKQQLKRVDFCLEVIHAIFNMNSGMNNGSGRDE